MANRNSQPEENYEKCLSRYLPKKEDLFDEDGLDCQPGKLVLKFKKADQQKTNASKLQAVENHKNVPIILIDSDEQKVEELKGDKGHGRALKFEGRPFVQAPARNVVCKKIYEYPPTCKTPGQFPWPPPRSQFRMFKHQMKESRKLN